MDKDRLRLYRTISNMTNNGNWTDASMLGASAGFDAYSLLNCYEYYEELDTIYLSMRDIAILSMYIERVNCGNKSKI